MRATKMTASRTTEEPSFFVTFGIVGLAEEVIDAGVIDAGELDEDAHGDIRGADFVFTVTGLRDIEHGCNLGLLPVMIFTEIANAGIGDYLSHIHHPSILYLSRNSILTNKREWHIISIS